MFKLKASIPALLIAAIVVIATPLAFAEKDSLQSNPHPEERDYNLVSVNGTVTALLYSHECNETDDDDDENETDDDDENETDEDDMNEGPKKNRTFEPILCAFVIDNETIVTFGPWWYWIVQNVTVADIVHLNDTVNVTGQMEDDDDMNILSAWRIENVTTGDELTIREEGRPPWAGGPKALGIDPWPPFEEDD